MGTGARPWRDRLMRSTRGRVLRTLRRGASTIPELASALGLSHNAVRAHLSNLERDGMVERVGRRRDGVGQPAVLYGITPEGEAFFPKAYESVLEHTLAVLEEEGGPSRANALLRSVGRRMGRRMARDPSMDGEGLEDRLRLLRGLLEELGGMVEIRGDVPQGPRLEGTSCPLAGVVRDHAGACKVVEALVEEIAGVPALERCRREGVPRCVFQLVAEEGA